MTNELVREVKKVVIYVTREIEGELQVLVFDHLKYPEVSPQVPSGTVESGEDILVAAKRELFEESGLKLEQEFHYLGSYEYFKSQVNQLQLRNHFLVFSKDLANEWTHAVTGSGVDQNLEFKYYWLPLLLAQATLQVGLGDGLAYFAEKINNYRNQ